MKRCATCHKEAADSATFCPFCGARGADGPQVVAPVVSGSAPEPRVPSPWDDAPPNQPEPNQPEPSDAESAGPESAPAANETPETLLGHPAVRLPLDEATVSAPSAPAQPLASTPTVRGDRASAAPKTMLGHPAIRDTPEASEPPADKPPKRSGRLSVRTTIGAPGVALRHLTTPDAGAPPGAALADLSAGAAPSAPSASGGVVSGAERSVTSGPAASQSLRDLTRQPIERDSSTGTGGKGPETVAITAVGSQWWLEPDESESAPVSAPSAPLPPVAESPEPAAVGPAAADPVSAPAVEAPAPPVESPVPAEKAPAPASNTPAAAEEASAPAIETSAPAIEPSAPADEVPAPVEAMEPVVAAAPTVDVVGVDAVNESVSGIEFGDGQAPAPASFDGFGDFSEFGDFSDFPTFDAPRAEVPTPPVETPASAAVPAARVNPAGVAPEIEPTADSEVDPEVDPEGADVRTAIDLPVVVDSTPAAPTREPEPTPEPEPAPERAASDSAGPAVVRPVPLPEGEAQTPTSEDEADTSGPEIVLPEVPPALLQETPARSGRVSDTPAAASPASGSPGDTATAADLRSPTAGGGGAQKPAREAQPTARANPAVSPAGPSAADTDDGWPPVALPELLVTAEDAPGVVPAPPRGLFAPIGYSFKARSAQRRLHRAEKRILERRERLVERCDAVATEVGRLAWRRGHGQGALKTLRQQSEALLQEEQEAAAALNAATREAEAAHAPLRYEVEEARQRVQQTTDTLAAVDARLNEVLGPMQHHEQQAEQAQAGADTVRREQSDGWERRVAELEGAVEEHTARAMGYRPLVAQVQEERLGPAQAHQEAVDGFDERRARLARARAVDRERLQPLVERLETARTQLGRVEAEATAECRALGERLLQVPREAYASQNGAWARAQQQLLEDEQTLVAYRSAGGTIVPAMIRRGRITLAVLVLVPLLVGLTWWLVTRAAETKDHGERVVEAPASAINPGTSPAGLAARALPAGLPAYLGVSFDGLRTAPLLKGIPGVDRLVAKELGMTPEGPRAGVAAIVEAGTSPRWAAVAAGGDVLQVVVESLTGRLGEPTDGVFRGGGLIRRPVANPDGGSFVLFGTDAKDLEPLAETVSAARDTGWASTGPVAPIAEFIDRGATLWAVATRDALEPLRSVGVNGELPRPLRRIVRRVAGGALTINVNQGLHVVLALMFDEPSQAGEAVVSLEAFRSDLQTSLADRPERSMVDAVTISADGAFVLLTLELEPERASALVEGLTREGLRRPPADG